MTDNGYALIITIIKHAAISRRTESRKKMKEKEKKKKKKNM